MVDRRGGKVANEWGCWLFGGLASGRRKTGQFPVVMWSPVRPQHTPNTASKESNPSVEVHRRKEGWGVCNMGPEYNNMCVWPLLAVQGHCMLLVASTPSDFSGSQNPQILPRGGQRARPVGMNSTEIFLFNNNMPSLGMPYLKWKENNTRVLLLLFFLKS